MTTKFDAKTNSLTFKDAKIIVENRKKGIQPAIFIFSNDRVSMITISADDQFVVSDEGLIGERYDENGKWCGEK